MYTCYLYPVNMLLVCMWICYKIQEVSRKFQVGEDDQEITKANTNSQDKNR